MTQTPYVLLNIFLFLISLLGGVVLFGGILGAIFLFAQLIYEVIKK